MSDIETRRWAVELATTNANRLQSIGHEVTMDMIERWACRFTLFSDTGRFEEPANEGQDKHVGFAFDRSDVKVWR